MNNYLIKITFFDGYELLSCSDESKMYEIQSRVGELSEDENLCGEEIVETILEEYSDVVKSLTDEVLEIEVEKNIY